ASGLMKRGSRVECARIEARVRDPLARRHIGRQDRELGENVKRADHRDPPYRNEPLEASRELGMLVYEIEGLLLETLQALREMLGVRLDVPGDGLGELCTATGRVQPIALLRARHGQGSDPTDNGPQIEDLRRWRVPGFERHSLTKLEQHSSIHAVR